jgi:hypothetical protein
VVRGIEGVSHYRVNSSGIRGHPFGPDRSEYGILAVGASTTECAQLDDTEVWTSLLERALDPMPDGRRVWVGNVGRSETTTREHALQTEHLLPEYPRIDVVLSMVGVNDLLSALKQGSRYQPPSREPDLARAFALYPQKSALWEVARRAKLSWNARRTFAREDAAGLGNESDESAMFRRTDTEGERVRRLFESTPPIRPRRGAKRLYLALVCARAGTHTAVASSQLLSVTGRWPEPSLFIMNISP